MKAAFLDRDGTIIENTSYVNHIAHIAHRPWVHGAIEGMKRLQAAGYELIIVTNQGGIGAGFLREEMLERIHHVLDLRLAQEGVFLTGVFACPHHPDANCGCRKPKPGLLEIAAHECGVDLAASIMIGDSESDVAAGLAAGLRASIQLPPSFPAGSGRDWLTLDLTGLCD